MLANLTRELDEEEASMPTITVNDGPVSPSAHYRRVTADPTSRGARPTARRGAGDRGRADARGSDRRRRPTRASSRSACPSTSRRRPR